MSTARGSCGATASLIWQVWVEDHGKVCRHYLSTWFVIDAVTVFVPFTFDMYLGGGGDAVLSNVGLVRVLRVCRLVKLSRLVRASRLFQRCGTPLIIFHTSFLGGVEHRHLSPPWVGGGATSRSPTPRGRCSSAR